ncbi:MAG: beta-lactamase family protein [Cyclobacteriaceae bacterium]|nr:beta-lactamase family protein [Cyclobacteriaceae bacterium]
MLSYRFILMTILVVIFSVPICLGQSINGDNLKHLLEGARASNTEALIVYQNDRLVLEEYMGVGQPDAKIESMSCTKSIVGLAVACLLTDGLLKNLDVPVYEFYPEWKQGQKQMITVRHLVTMTSGLQNNPNASVEIYPSPDFVQLALAGELSTVPGEVWSYNNKSLNLMAGVIQKITGKRMDVYIEERLFKPLAVTDFTWSLDPSGNPHVMSGCQIKPSDFAKIGLLLLNKGKFGNVQVIKSSDVEQVITPCEKFKGYGMLWWLDYQHTITIVNDDIIANLKKAELPIDFIKKAQQLKGVYKTTDEYGAKVESVFGANPWQSINEILAPRNLTLRKREFSGKVTYRADGYLGNYIIVDPENKLVAVRMISHSSFKDDKDNFHDFRNRVLNLCNK